MFWKHWNVVRAKWSACSHNAAEITKRKLAGKKNGLLLCEPGREWRPSLAERILRLQRVLLNSNGYISASNAPRLKRLQHGTVIGHHGPIPQPAFQSTSLHEPPRPEMSSPVRINKSSAETRVDFLARHQWSTTARPPTQHRQP